VSPLGSSVRAKDASALRGAEAGKAELGKEPLKQQSLEELFFSRSFSQPDERVEFPLATIDTIKHRAGPGGLTRSTLKPGWVWKTHMGPSRGTELCEHLHFGVILQGEIMIQPRGKEPVRVRTGQVVLVPRGHNAWVPEGQRTDTIVLELHGTSALELNLESFGGNVVVREFSAPSSVKQLGSSTCAVVQLNEQLSIARLEAPAGWKWSKDVKPTVGTEWCQHSHMCMVFGPAPRMECWGRDGGRCTIGPVAAGDAAYFEVPPNHDAEIFGQGNMFIYDFAAMAIIWKQGKVKHHSAMRQWRTLEHTQYP